MKLRRAWSLGVLVVCVTAALIFRQFAFVAYYPVGMSAFLACAFGFSLYSRPLCLVLAETLPPHLLPDGVESYCRKLTALWCLVLSVNGLIALGTVFGPRVLWFAWNCALSYGLMGAMVLGERIVRRRVFAVAFHTSGSTATPKTIIKTFDSLAHEVVYHRDQTLLALQSIRPSILATIEPGHMYGTLWRVLLARATGWEIDPDVIFTPEALLAKMRAREKVMLVTTPSFLERLTAYADQYEIPSNCVEIITSGALLTADVSAAAKRLFGVAPLEIFGSTETGGVAWRRQGLSSEPFDWTLLDPVSCQLNDEGRLIVDSPFSCQKHFVMGDAAELAPDGRHFKLLGRRDRLVKIAEQRVSLPEMEERIKALPNVRAAALTALTGAHGPCLGAVVVLDVQGLSPEVWGLSPRTGLCKRALALKLRQMLLPIFPKGTVPKKYRFVAEIPHNAQGKVQSAALRRLFESEIGEPFVLNAVRTEDSWSADLIFDPEAVYFEGHFPGFPVLAGVVQVDVAKHFAEQLLRREIVPKSVKKMKFTGVVCPGDKVHLTVLKKSETECVYQYTKNNSVSASGVLCF